METEKIEQKKEDFKKTLDDLLERVEKEQENLKRLQEKFNQQKKEIKK